MTRDEMQQLTAGAPSISEKIRLLHDAGATKTEISTFLGRRYQHVYNVIKDHEARQAENIPKPVDAPTPALPEVISLSLGCDGSLSLPADWIAAQGLRPGDTLLCRAEAHGLLIMSQAAATEALLELARRKMPEQAALLGALLGTGSKE